MKYTDKLEKAKEEFLKGKVCEKCGSNFNITCDHIIPLAFLTDLMGLNKIDTFDIENFQALCYRCNSLKRFHLDLNNPKTKILLKKYIDKYCI